MDDFIVLFGTEEKAICFLYGVSFVLAVHALSFIFGWLGETLASLLRDYIYPGKKFSSDN